MSPSKTIASGDLSIVLLAAAGFASGSGMRLLDPLLPGLAEDFGVSVSKASSLIAAFLLTYGAGQIVVGPLGDRLGKPRVACVALIAYGVALIACTAATTLGGLIVGRAAAGLFAGAVIPLLMAHIGDTVPYARRQEAIGQFLTGMVTAQLVTGPVSGIIGERFGWQASFVALGAAALIVAALIARGLGRTASLARSGARGFGFGAYAGLLARPAGRRLLIAAFCDGMLLFGGAFPFVGSYLIQDFHLTPTTAGLVAACFGAGAFGYVRFARALVLQFGERGLLLLGGVGLAIGLSGLAAATGWPMAGASQAVLGLCFYMFHGVLQARATEALPEARGTAVSAFAMALFMGQCAGSIAFGAALGTAGYRGNFAVAAVLMLVLALWTRGGGGKPTTS